MKDKSHKQFKREIKANIRDSILLLKQFRIPLLLFIMTIVGGGFLYALLSSAAGEPLGSTSQAIYHVLGLIFLSPTEPFPKTWYLQTFWFLSPLIGIGILAHGIADFGVLFFNRRARGKEWEMAVASTFSNHIILVGLGHLGFRTARYLHEMGKDVVIIDINPKAELIETTRDFGIPLLVDDGTREVTLRSAGIEKAKAIILCTQDDSLNLQMAVKARSINPDVQVTIRIFDDDFAHALQKQFGFKALSSTGMASPVFAASAAGVDMTRPIIVDGEPLSLAKLTIKPGTALEGHSVRDIERQYHVSIILVRSPDGKGEYHPSPTLTLKDKTSIAFLGRAAAISSLASANEHLLPPDE